jgi:hypothetical protein
MHWIHSSRQGWLVLATGAALLGGCGAAHAEPGQRPDLAAPPAEAAPPGAAQPAPPETAADGPMMLHAGL